MPFSSASCVARLVSIASPFQSSFRAVSEQFQSGRPYIDQTVFSFYWIIRFSHSSIQCCSIQPFQSSFRAVPEPSTTNHCSYFKRLWNSIKRNLNSETTAIGNYRFRAVSGQLRAIQDTKVTETKLARILNQSILAQTKISWSQSGLITALGQFVQLTPTFYDITSHWFLNFVFIAVYCVAIETRNWNWRDITLCNLRQQLQVQSSWNYVECCWIEWVMAQHSNQSSFRAVSEQLSSGGIIDTLIFYRWRLVLNTNHQCLPGKSKRD